MENKINYSSYAGSASELCSKGDAAEFIQPWYIPISTTPENTGLAVGGIGNTFTLTPEGKTPNFSFIPGVFIDCSHQDINFNDFFISTMDLPSIENLALKSIAEVCRFLSYYPAKFSGAVLDLENTETLLESIKSGISDLTFYPSNKESFAKWDIDFSDKTKHYIDQQPQSLMTQILVAIDFFDGLLINDSAVTLSLTANSDNGVSAINSEKIHYKALYPIAEYHYSQLDDIQLDDRG